MAREECLWCESRKIADGTRSGTCRDYFKARKARFWTFSENLVEVRARVCVDCGYVDLYADPSKLKKLVKP